MTLCLTHSSELEQQALSQKKLNRNWIGIENNSYYFKIAEERLKSKNEEYV